MSCNTVRRIRETLGSSPAMLVALAALFIALGGTTYAAIRLPAGSVGTKQLKDGAVTSKKVQDHSLLARDFKAGQLPRGATGSAGAQGAQGPPGLPGMQGLPGPPGAQGPSAGFQSFKDQTTPGYGELTTMVSMDVPAGSSLVTAKLWVENPAGSTREVFRCVLTNDENADSDTTQVTVDPIGSDTMYGQAAMSLAAASTLPRAGHWILRCSKSHPNPGGEAHNVKMQAIQVGSLTNSPSP